MPAHNHLLSGSGAKARASADLQRPIAAGLQLGRAHAEAIDESHQRCIALGVTRIERPDLSPLGRTDLTLLRERNRRLHGHAAPVMEVLYEQIATSHSMVVLTDASGNVLHSIGDDDFLERAARVALQPGANWSEASKGTNAVGTALVQEAPTLVHADEHFLHANQFLTCSAAPILDPRGNLLGVLDVSGDHRGYHPHTMALVKMSARMIENRWLSDDCHNVMQLHFHCRVDFIGTLMEGILSVTPDGAIVGANRGALEQLGLNGVASRRHTLSSLFGTAVGALVDRFRSPLATPAVLKTPDGRAFHVQARFDWPVWSRLAATGTAHAPAPPQAASAAERPIATSRPTPPSPAPATRAGMALQALRCGDPQVDSVLDKVGKLVDRGVPLLILGEAGCGKRTLAQAFHHASARAAGPFVEIDCRALSAHSPDGSLNSHLQRARGGTLFLAHVDALGAGAQRQLRQALGPLPAGAATRSLDFTLVASRRQGGDERVEAASFDEALLALITGLTVHLPALRERSDLPALVARRLEHEGATRLRVDDDVMDLLCRFAWPGNLRQLAALLHTACVMARDDACITRAHLSDDFIAAASVPTVPSAPGTLKVDSSVQAPSVAAPSTPPSGAPKTLLDLEHQAIHEAVERCSGNISAAAKRLGVSRNTIYRKLHQRSG